MVGSCPVAVQDCIEGWILQPDINGLAVLISSLLVLLLLESCISSLQQRLIKSMLACWGLSGTLH